MLVACRLELANTEPFSGTHRVLTPDNPQNATSLKKALIKRILGRKGWRTLPESAVFVFSYSKAKASGQDIDHLDFKIVVEPKDASSFTVILVASSRQEKAAWTSDISQVGPSRQAPERGAQWGQ